MASSKDNGKQHFGGIWTVEKMDAVEKYLDSFTKVMKNQNFFETIYIDAFAGSGECIIGSEANNIQIDGSAIRSLNIANKFDNYIFVESKKSKINLLRQVCETNHSDLLSRIKFINADANDTINKLLDTKAIGKNKRGVIFLDPFGASVTWETLEKIASTKVLDVWYLFPLSAILRFASKDLEKALEDNLDDCLGTTEWRHWYNADNQSVRTIEDVLTFFSKRLKTLFPLTLNPVILKNSTNSPMFAMYFAMGNDSPRATEVALDIASYILSMFEEKKLANDVRPLIKANIQKDRLKKQKKKHEEKGQSDLFD